MCPSRIHDITPTTLWWWDTCAYPQSGSTPIYRTPPLFAVEAIQEYGPNVMSFEVATEARRWYIIGCYLAPDDTSTIERVVATIRDRPKGTALVVAGDLNTDLEDSDNDWRGTEIAVAMTAAGVEDMTAQFLPRRRRWGRERRTWSMVQEGKVVRSRTDYLLGTDRSLFRNVSVRDPRPCPLAPCSTSFSPFPTCASLLEIAPVMFVFI